MLQVPSLHTPGDSHSQASTQPSVAHIQAPCKACTVGCVMFRDQIWASSLNLLSCLSTLDSVCVYVCVQSCYTPMCVAVGSVCSYMRICIMLPQGGALSHPKESLWERDKEGFRECAKLSDGFVSITGCVWPRGCDRRSEQRVSTKEQQIQCRQSPTNPFLK